MDESKAKYCDEDVLKAFFCFSRLFPAFVLSESKFPVAGTRFVSA